ncbi:hypothetical protein G6F24_018820 [Rhizopus arrhizus]|nr:hypothetical protein G6F24_018820 [Rhizopus arrhizus]
MTSSENFRLPPSSSESATICVVRLPAATWRAMLAASTIGSSRDRDRLQPMPKMAITPSAMTPQPRLAPRVSSVAQLACSP